MPKARRFYALDAFRGWLAVLVVIDHVVMAFGSRALELPGLVAVLTFFLMSGFVLTRSYDGRASIFMVRRIVRLWPLFAAGTIIGCLIRGWILSPYELAWITTPQADSPAWSLRYEVLFSPLVPVFVFLCRPSRWIGVIVAVGIGCMTIYDGRYLFIASFAAGSVISHFRFEPDFEVSKTSVWLGKISYSLYLTHALVIAAGVNLFGAQGAIVMSPLLLPIA